MSRPVDPHEIHAPAVAVANLLLDDALDTGSDLDFPARRGLLLLAASVEREGARRAGIKPDDGDVLRASVRALARLRRRCGGLPHDVLWPVAAPAIGRARG